VGEDPVLVGPYDPDGIEIGLYADRVVHAD
jgi:hypothetical protein